MATGSTRFTSRRPMTWMKLAASLHPCPLSLPAAACCRRAERARGGSAAGLPARRSVRHRRTAARCMRWSPGAGPDLVLIHGSSGNTRDFTFGFVDTVKDRYRVIVFDRPGPWLVRPAARRRRGYPRTGRATARRGTCAWGEPAHRAGPQLWRGRCAGLGAGCAGQRGGGGQCVGPVAPLARAAAAPLSGQLQPCRRGDCGAADHRLRQGDQISDEIAASSRRRRCPPAMPPISARA